jgi:hypothetical protein
MTTDQKADLHRCLQAGHDAVLSHHDRLEQPARKAAGA